MSIEERVAATREKARQRRLKSQRKAARAKDAMNDPRIFMLTRFGYRLRGRYWKAALLMDLNALGGGYRCDKMTMWVTRRERIPDEVFYLIRILMIKRGFTSSVDELDKFLNKS